MVNKQASGKRLVLYKQIETIILTLRGEKVILDSDLASIYGVSTARLNQQVKRNNDRFPKDFVLRVTKKEFNALMLHFATSKPTRGGRRKPPLAFTEHGAIMAANVLNSSKAVKMSVLVVRAFVQLRKNISITGELAKKLEDIERKVINHDSNIQEIIEAIRQLMQPPEVPKKAFGFTVNEPKIIYKNKNKSKSKI